MKSSIIKLIVILMSLTLVACYEGVDIEKEFYDQYTEATITDSESSIGMLTAEIPVKLSHAKKECELKFYYSDQADVDLLKEGRLINILNATDKIIEDLDGDYKISLEDLMPGREYRYCFTYSDKSGYSYRSEEKRFKTEDIDISLYTFNEDYFRAMWNMGKSTLPEGAVFGYLLGDTEDVSLDNCKINQQLDTWPNTDYVYNWQYLTNLTPGTTYYLRMYANYRDSIYYQNEPTRLVTPAIEPVFDTPSVSTYGDSEYYVSAYIALKDNENPVSYYKGCEYGIQLSSSSEFDVYKEIPLDELYAGYPLGALTSGSTYYVRSYFRWQGYVEKYSEVISFNVN